MATMIGLTGGIGSGKSVVAKIFATIGIPVFNADEEAKRIMQTSPEIKAKLIEQFGADIYNAHGLDKEKLAAIVFNDPFQLQLLNAIVHPVTIQAAKDWAAIGVELHGEEDVNRAMLAGGGGEDKAYGRLGKEATSWTGTSSYRKGGAPKKATAATSGGTAR